MSSSLRDYITETELINLKKRELERRFVLDFTACSTSLGCEKPRQKPVAVITQLLLPFHDSESLKCVAPQATRHTTLPLLSNKGEGENENRLKGDCRTGNKTVPCFQEKGIIMIAVAKYMKHLLSFKHKYLSKTFLL